MRNFASLVSLALFWGVAAAQTPAAPAAPAVRPAGLYAHMQVAQGTTTLGTFVIKLHETEAPVTVRNFVDLALGRKLWKDPKTGARVRRPLYNGLTFHRVIPGFMIQGGDPTGTGEGETDYIKDEFHPALKFDKPGVVAMANSGPNTGSCQFFITEGLRPQLNDRFPIFGQVVEGQPLVARIANVPRGENNRPIVAVTIASLTFERIGPVPPNGIVLPPVRKPAAKPAPKAAKKAAPKVATKK